MHVQEANPQLDDRAAVTDRLRDAVKRAGGGTEVATRSEVPLSTLNGYLAGGEIKLSNLIKLARACGVSVEWLATGGAPHPPWLRNLVGETVAFKERQAPLPAPAINVRWLAKAIEIVEALGGEKLPLVERARRIAHSYELLTAPDADIPPLPPVAPRGR